MAGRRRPRNRLAAAILKILSRYPELSPQRRNRLKGQLERLARVFARSRPSGRPQRYDPHLLRERVDGLLNELSKRFSDVGVWPDTGSKWAANTDAYLRGWWARR